MASFARGRRTRGAIAILAGLLFSTIASGAGQVAKPDPSGLAGTYDGGQMEMAVGLQLRPDGRFDYGLSYGALDESAGGTWSSDRDHVFLTSDPVKPPKFVFVDARPAPDGKMRVVLDLPKGWSRQIFQAAITLDDGRVVGGQLSDDDDTIALEPGARPVSMRLGMDIYDLRSDAFRLTGAARSIHVRFEMNDLGKVAFAREPLRIDGKTLTFDRYGRSIVFRRVDPQP